MKILESSPAYTAARATEKANQRTAYDNSE